ncbi:MFS transporter [Nigerium massiliense]|uniref:MFS transporter n=1 Tax=Nigerium massiliense TaxID=1522317 RepID=UPI00058B6494|nr:MFS transporter [Nigerium massiliense]
MIAEDQLRELARTEQPSGKRRSAIAVAGAATLGSVLFGYDTGVISGALPYMAMPPTARGLGVDPWQEGFIGGALLIGAAIGALVTGRLADRNGRRHTILVLAVIFLVGSVGSALAPIVEVMYPFRFILGFAVGGASATVPVYLSETAPQRIRGTIVAADQLMIVSGQLLAFLANAGVNHAYGGPQLTVASDPSGTVPPGPHPWDDVAGLQASRGGPLDPATWQSLVDHLVISGGNGSAWRVMLVLCSIPAIALWVAMRRMPESPRWSMANHRYVEAVRSLLRLRDRDDPATGDELGEMLAVQRLAEAQPRASLRDVLRTPWMRRLFGAGVLLSVCNQTTGVNTVMYYAPKVLEYAGLGASAAITAQVSNGIMSVIGAAGGLWLIHRFRRRQVLITCIVLVAACMFALGGLFTWLIQPHLASGTLPPAYAPTLILVVMGFFMLVVQAANGPVVWTMMGEMFPSRVRGAAAGAAVFCGWMTNALITVTFPTLLATLGGGPTYAAYGVLNVVVAIALFKVMPETSGRSLEELEGDLESRYDKALTSSR